MSAEPVLILFAKKPIAGEVKTRLSPPLSTTQAQEVAQLLIQQSLENASRYWQGTIELSLWPDFKDDFVQTLLRDYHCTLSVQNEGNLGDKMYAALSFKLASKRPVLIMGCDVPHCPGDILRKAHQNLELGKNIIGPTIDGGYYCIGTQSTNVKMFDGVDWGTERAFAQTITGCRSCGIEFDSLLPELRDLDCYDDLVVISEHCPMLKAYLI